MDLVLALIALCIAAVLIPIFHFIFGPNHDDED